MGIFTRVICVLGLVPALFAMGSVGNPCARYWAMNGYYQRQKAEAKRQRELPPPPDLAQIPKELAAIPEEKLDMGRASLTLARDIWPTLDVEAYSKKIDVMVEEVRVLTDGSTDPDKRVRILNTYLYKIVGIDYDRDDAMAEKPENRYINGIVDSKRGTCITMPLLYMTIAQRLGYPVRGVTAPRHQFVRYVDPKLKQQNIEATGGGGFSSNEEIIRDLKILPRAVQTGLYLRTLSNKEFLGVLVHIAAGWFINQIPDNKTRPAKQLELVQKARAYLEVAEKLNPMDDAIMVGLGDVHQRLFYFENKAAGRGRSLASEIPIDRYTFDFVKTLREMEQTTKMNHDGHRVAAARYFDLARELGANPRDFSEDWEKEYRAEVAARRPKAELRRLQYELERPGLLQALQRMKARKGML